LTCCVYSIINTVNGKRYIGSTSNHIRRFRAHKWSLRRGSHHSLKLQRAWDKYGEQAFVFSIMIEASPEHLLMYEQRALDVYGVSSGYNILHLAGTKRGSKVSDETLAKMKKSQRSVARKYEWKGEMLCLAEISEAEGIKHKLLIDRVLHQGLTVDEAVNTKLGRGKPKIKKSRMDFFIDKEKRMSLTELSLLLGFPKGLIRGRIYRGWTLIEAMETMPSNGKRKYNRSKGFKVRDNMKTTQLRSKGTC